jgi:hypothetical protein
MAVVVSLALTVACGGGGGSGAKAAPGDGGPLGTVQASTPIPTQAGPPLIRTTIDGDCRLTGAGATIRVEFAVTATGSTQLTRVRLLQDGKDLDDSGEIEQRSYQRVITVDAGPGEQHVYRVMAESQAGAGPPAQTTVRCGTQASPTAGPRA